MFFDDTPKRKKPTQALKKIVFTRDNGTCRICGQKVDPFNFDVGHDLAHSKGGKLTVQNAILLCGMCNRSMGTLSLKQARKALGIKAPEDDAKKLLQKLSIKELKYLAKNHRIKVKGTVEEGFLGNSVKAPSKTKYVNALSKELNCQEIENELKTMPKAETKTKKKRKKSTGGFFF